MVLVDFGKQRLLVVLVWDVTDHKGRALVSLLDDCIYIESALLEFLAVGGARLALWREGSVETLCLQRTAFLQLGIQLLGGQQISATRVQLRVRQRHHGDLIHSTRKEVVIAQRAAVFAPGRV